MKYRYIFFMLFVFYFIYGCDNSQNKVTNTKVFSGTQGVNMEILSKSLPNAIYENDRVDMYIKLTNKGAIPIAASNSLLKITGEKGYLEFTTGSHLISDSFELRGKDDFLKMDDFTQKSYTLISKTLDSQSIQHPVIVLATICYNYMTKAYADVCIDTDVYNTRPIQKVCSAKTVGLSGGQGAPVAVTSVDVKMLGDASYARPQFIITIENTDSGSVINNINTICSSGTPTKDDYNSVILSALKFSDFSLANFDCEPNKNGNVVAKLNNEKDEIICTLKNGLIPKNSATYQTPLYIELTYGYTLSKSAQITIEKMPT